AKGAFYSWQDAGVHRSLAGYRANQHGGSPYVRGGRWRGGRGHSDRVVRPARFV
ncbi:MAG: hypothetical protein AVDCRST_MAG86-4062, partial [uncultured Truepera sp.]